MKQYTWLLPAQIAFDLSEKLATCSIFENQETGLWQIDLLVENHEQDQYLQILSVFPPAQIASLEEQDWLKKSFEALAPIDVKDFYIHSSMYLPSLSHRFSLCLEAATAFGSGHHETTQGCLFLIQQLWEKDPWTRALDLGCGSGILAMAMNSLNPGSAFGSDNDPEAIRVATENAILNNIPTAFTLADGVPQNFDKIDVVVANIFSDILIDLAPYLTAPRNLILSGMLLDQAPKVLEAYGNSQWKLHASCPLGEWISVWLCH